MGCRTNGLKRITCRQVPVQDGWTELVPWGVVESMSGTFYVNEGGTQQAIQAFRSHGVDIPIDVEHATINSDSAPAVGWIKDLKALPGRALLGLIEWTDKGRQLLEEKSYRYLSPVVLCQEDTDVVVRLHSVALTNKPAIPGMKALVNAEPQERQNSMDKVTKALATMLGLSESAGLPEIADAVAVLASSSDDADANVWMDKAAEFLSGLASALADLGQSDAAGEGDTTMSANAHKLVMKANREMLAMRKQRRDDEWRMVVNRYRTKTTPAGFAAVRAYWEKDPKAAERFLEDLPMHFVFQAEEASRAGGDGGGRSKMIFNACRAFKAEAGTKRVTCSQRAWVNAELRSAGQTPLSEKEISDYAVAT
jgi:phage I-like protein